jgi:hypothetical protein
MVEADRSRFDRTGADRGRRGAWGDTERDPRDPAVEEHVVEPDRHERHGSVDASVA